MRSSSPAAKHPDPNTVRRVLFLSWRDSSHPEGGGSELYVERMAEWLASCGHKVTIVCADHGRSARDEVRSGVLFRRRGGRLTVYVRGLGYLLSAAGRQADVVVDVQNGLPFWSRLVRRAGRIVVLIHHVHREQWRVIYPGWQGRLGWWLESRAAPRLYRQCRHITVSEASKADLERLGISPEQISVVRNGASIAAAGDSVQRSAAPTVCTVSRLVPHKQIEQALEVVAKLRTELTDLRLEVVGDGWWADRVRARASELGLDGTVTWHGRLTDAERDQVLARSWVMLAPSIKEGWGVAIMEAATAGVPSIAFRSAGGVCESIEDGVTGLLVDDVDGMLDATRTLLTDAAARQRLGVHARQRAATFPWARAQREFAATLGLLPGGAAVVDDVD